MTALVVYHADNYEFRTSKHHPKMVLVEVKARDANSLILNAPDMESHVLRLPSNNEHEVIVKHFRNEEVPSIDCGDEVAIWISQYILGKDRGLRIAYNDGSYKRTQINKIYKDLEDYHKRGLRNESS
ncbi:hypothetical protein NQ318_011911, partial [Aromia moschata]